MRLTAKLKSARKFLKECQKNIPRLASTIEKSKMVIQLLHLIEESRDLEVHEWNFEDILQDHLSNLLDWQKIYWKQRGRIKWVTKGDAGTKIFHANATIRHMHNLITTIKDNEGTILSNHE
jgi:hypothetical protein